MTILPFKKKDEDEYKFNKEEALKRIEQIEVINELPY